MAVTPLFSFRPTPAVVTAMQTIQALLSQRSGRDIGKTEAIAYAVQRAAEDLQAKADREQRQEERTRPVGGIGGELARKADRSAEAADAEDRRHEADRLAREGRIAVASRA